MLTQSLTQTILCYSCTLSGKPKAYNNDCYALDHATIPALEWEQRYSEDPGSNVPHIVTSKRSKQHNPGPREERKPPSAEGRHNNG